MRVGVLLCCGAVAVLAGGCVERRAAPPGHPADRGKPGMGVAAATGRSDGMHLTMARFHGLPEFHGRLVALDVLDASGRPLPPGGGSFLRLTIVSAAGTVYVIEDFTTFRADFVTVVADLLATDRIYPRDLSVPRTIE